MTSGSHKFTVSQAFTLLNLLNAGEKANAFLDAIRDEYDENGASTGVARRIFEMPRASSISDVATESLGISNLVRDTSVSYPAPATRAPFTPGLLEEMSPFDFDSLMWRSPRLDEPMPVTPPLPPACPPPASIPPGGHAVLKDFFA